MLDSHFGVPVVGRDYGAGLVAPGGLAWSRHLGLPAAGW